MFYEESQIEKILQCPRCKIKFDEPRILPCGQAVCSKCIQFMLMMMKYNDGSFKCTLCDEFHSKSTFPINEALMELLKKQPSEVYRSEKVEELKQNLKEISSNKFKLENYLRNGINQLSDHCIKVRCDIDLATEKAIQDIQEKRDELHKKVDDYEKKCVVTIQSENKSKEPFEKIIKELDQFSEGWSNYLKKSRIDDKKITKSNELAIKLMKDVEVKMMDLDSFIFNDYKIYFENKTNKLVIGDIKFEKMSKMSRKIDSLILSEEQEKCLLSLIGFESEKFDLLWRGSRDGFGAETFHSLCDSKGATITVIKSISGYIFGGFASVSWTSSCDNKGDDEAFLFTLTNPSSMPLKLMNKEDKYAIKDYSDYGPSFGKYGHCLSVSSDSNLNSKSYCYSGSSFETPNGQNGYKGGKFIHGGGMGNEVDKFQTVELEVYLVS